MAGVDIEIYRSRIGTFSPSRHHSYKTTCTHSDQTRKNSYFYIRIRTLLVILQVFVLLRNPVSLLQTPHGVYSSRPVHINFQPTTSSCNGLSCNNFQWSSTAFFGTMPSNIIKPNNSNFYGRYTYGNRSTRGIKLSHWNAGSAFLENEISDIENVIANHHPHLLGISEANLHRNHSIDNCKIDDYEIITSKTISNMNLQVSRVVVYKHTSLVAKVRKDLRNSVRCGLR